MTYPGIAMEVSSNDLVQVNANWEVVNAQVEDALAANGFFVNDTQYIVSSSTFLATSGVDSSTFDPYIIAFLPDGTLLWSQPINDHAIVFDGRSPGEVYFYDTGNGDIVKVTETGAGDWAHTENNAIRMACVDRDNAAVYLATDGTSGTPAEIVKLDASDGSELWRSTILLGGNPFENPIVSGGSAAPDFVRACSADDNIIAAGIIREVHIYSPTTGDQLNVQDTGINTSFDYLESVFVASDGNVLVCSHEGQPF